jgi:hypothetical protein
VIEAAEGTIFESELRDIIWFDNLEQETCVGSDEKVTIFYKPNRLGH